MKGAACEENGFTARGPGAMEKAEALALIGEMLRGEPEARGAVAALLRHPWWPGPFGVGGAIPVRTFRSWFSRKFSARKANKGVRLASPAVARWLGPAARMDAVCLALDVGVVPIPPCISQ